MGSRGIDPCSGYDGLAGTRVIAASASAQNRRCTAFYRADPQSVDFSSSRRHSRRGDTSLSANLSPQSNRIYCADLLRRSVPVIDAHNGNLDTQRSVDEKAQLMPVELGIGQVMRWSAAWIKPLVPLTQWAGPKRP